MVVNVNHFFKIFRGGFYAAPVLLRVAQQLQDEYNERFNNEFDVNWREARKEKFYKDNAWAVRVKDDNNKTIVFLNSDMLRG